MDSPVNAWITFKTNVEISKNQYTFPFTCGFHQFYRFKILQKMKLMKCCVYLNHPIQYLRVPVAPKVHVIRRVKASACNMAGSNNMLMQQRSINSMRQVTFTLLRRGEDVFAGQEASAERVVGNEACQPSLYHKKRAKTTMERRGYM